MSQLSLLADTSEGPAKRFAEWVTESKNRSSSVRQMLVHRTGGSGSSSWPGVRAVEATGGAYTRDGGQKGQERPSLTGAAQEWPTPRVANVRGSKQRREQGSNESIQSQAETWNTPMAKDGGKRSGGTRKDDDLSTQGEQRPTPAARDMKGGTVYRGGVLQLDQLDRAAEHWDSSLQVQQTEKHGEPSSSDTQSSPQQSQQQWGGPRAGAARAKDMSYDRGKKNIEEEAAAFHNPNQEKRRLNPLFVEWLMGFPTGWANHQPLEPTSYECWETQWSRLLRLLLSPSYAMGFDNG
jgi:hypothetical protein